MSRRRSHSQSPGRYSRSCSSNDPRDLERRIFVGNLPTSDMEKKDLESIFSPYGKIVGVSMFRGFGFVQFEHVEEAEAAKAGQKGQLYKGYKIDVNMAAERRQAKPRQSPPRRAPYASYGESRESRPRSRSPVYGRDGREPRDGAREGREPSREPRPSAHPREHDSRYRGSESREKDPREPRGDAHPRDTHSRDPPYREEYDRYYRSGSGADPDYYRKKDDRFRDPWNGRREPEEERARPEERLRPEERRRNELYRQYYEELQRRYDTDRPVDCSVIVINKAQNREYAETVGRKVRDLGMVVDLIFLNTEVSLTQALEDVGRARTPFAIIITQQHQVHRSCTVNILFGTPQEHRNMPMQDAMVLVAHNYDAYKVEHREKEREEIARKAAKMADDVLLREPDRETYPISLLTTITLMSENKFITPEELESLSVYLKDKRDRLVRTSGDIHTAPASHLEAQPKAPVLPPPPHAAPKPSQVALPPVSNPPPNSSQQQELQAKILSLFNSGAGGTAASTASTAAPSMVFQPQGYGSSMTHSSSHPPPSQAPPMMGPRPPMPPAGPPPCPPQGYGMPSGRMPAALGSQRPPSSASGINFDNPSVQKALDTLIQSGPSLNHLVNSGSSQQPPPRPTQGMGQGMGQAPPMSMYPRHY